MHSSYMDMVHIIRNMTSHENRSRLPIILESTEFRFKSHLANFPYESVTGIGNS